MITVQYLMLAENAKEDNDGELSLVRIFDKYATEKIPVVLEPFYIVIGVVGSHSDDGQQFTLKFRGTDHLPKDAFPFTYKFKEGLSNTLIRVEKFPVKDFGIITVEVLYRNQTLAKYPFTITKKEE
jgi:hypothetical protein